MHKALTALTLSALLALPACHSPAEVQQSYLDAAKRQCAAYGFSANTPDFAQCVQQEYQSALAQRRAATKSAEQEFKEMSRPAYQCGTIGGSAVCY